MLKKVYHMVLPESLKQKIREKSPYYQCFQELQKQAAATVTELESARRQIQAKEQEIRAKEQEIARITTAHQAEMDALNQRLRAAEQEIARITAVWKSLQEKTFSLPSVPENQQCRICGQPVKPVFSKRIMDRYDIAYLACEHCRHIQTEKPYWLEDAYKSALSDSDTGQIWRNERNRDIVCAVTHRFFTTPPKVLEYAGGYGLLTRMLRDSGMECRWYDKYAENIFARHFEDDGTQQYDLVLAFEALEHFEDPMRELENIFQRGGSLLFSEELLPDLCPVQWWYLCTEHGQHVNFYSRETLQYIADHFHKNLYVYGDVGLMTPLEIKPEDFADTLEHADTYARAFHESSTSLTQTDMETVIKAMERK